MSPHCVHLKIVRLLQMLLALNLPYACSRHDGARVECAQRAARPARRRPGGDARSANALRQTRRTTRPTRTTRARRGHRRRVQGAVAAGHAVHAASRVPPFSYAARFRE